MSEERMCKRPVIVNEAGKTKKLERILLTSKTFKENWMQVLLEDEPHLLPTASIDNVFAPLLCVAREISAPAGYIDNLYISPKGYLVVVETKLWRNPEAKREVIGQVLDYAKDVKEWDYDKLDSIYREFHGDKNTSLFDALVAKGYQTPENEASFIDITEKNIKSARFLLMIVGDGIREGVEKMADFLNENPSMQYRLALCELEVYDLGDGQRLVVPQLTTKTNIIERGIIRVEEGTSKGIEIVLHKETEKETVGKKSTSAPVDGLTVDEFYNRLSKKNHEMTKNALVDLFDDIIDMGFEYRIGGADCVISYPVPGSQVKIPLLRFSVENKVWFLPSEIFKRLEQLGYSTSIGDKLLTQYKPFLTLEQKNPPYEKLNGFYFVRPETLVKNKEDLVSIWEDFKTNF